MSDRLRVVAVVVTHNRRALLLEALAAIEAQRRSPDAVLVVDNASDDGTPGDVRTRFPGAQLIELRRNSGGAGGFAAGIAAALAGGADAVWLMDDDTVPAPDALAELLHARESHSVLPALVASRVEWVDGAPHPMNTPRRKPFASRRERTAAAAVGCVPIRSASFVSVLIDAAVADRRGLPVADYFLWNDDFEYTARLLRREAGLLCPTSVVVHKTKTFGSTDAEPGERFYLEVRNKLWMLLRSDALNPLERAVYGGSTLRRWLRTFVRSHERDVLWGCLKRGVRDGLHTHPRPTEEILAHLN